MPNRQIFNPISDNVKTQIYGSNTEIPIQVDEKGDVIVSITELTNGITISDVSNITIASMPVVAVSSMPDIIIDSIPAVTIASMPNVTISGISTVNGALSITGVVGIDADASLSISGTPAVRIAQPISVTGTVSLDGGTVQDGALLAELSGTPTVLVTEPVSVTGTLGLASGSTVSILGNVQTGSGFTSLTVLAANVGSLAAITTLATDISAFQAYSYFIHIQANTNLDLSTFTATVQYSSINSEKYFASSSKTSGSINLPRSPSSPVNLILTDTTGALQYSRLNIISLAANGNYTFTVYLQGYLR